MLAKPLQQYIKLFRYQATTSQFEESPRGGTYFSIERPIGFYQKDYDAGGGTNLIERQIDKSFISAKPGSGVKKVFDPVPGKGYLIQFLQDRSPVKKAIRPHDPSIYIDRFSRNLYKRQNVIRYAKSTGASEESINKFFEYLSNIDNKAEQNMAILDWLGANFAKAKGIKAIVGSPSRLDKGNPTSTIMVLDKTILQSPATETLESASHIETKLGDLRLNPIEGFKKLGLGSALRRFITGIKSPASLKVIAYSQESAERFAHIMKENTLYRYQATTQDFELGERGGVYFSIGHPRDVYKDSYSSGGGSNLIKRYIDTSQRNKIYMGLAGRQEIGAVGGAYYDQFKHTVGKIDIPQGIDEEQELLIKERIAADIARKQGYKGIQGANSFFALEPDIVTNRPPIHLENESLMNRLGSQTFTTKELASEMKPMSLKMKAGIVGAVTAGVGLTSLLMAKHAAYSMANQDDRRRRHPYRSTRSIQSSGIFG